MLKKLKPFFILFICCAISVSCSKSATSPKAHLRKNNLVSYLSVQDSIISFGKVHQAKKHIKCTFKLRNDGNNNISINKIDVSCGCLKPSLSSIVIRPQKEEILTIDVDLTKQYGNINKSIIILSSAENAYKILRVKGTIFN